jgi:hypothetical protein
VRRMTPVSASVDRLSRRVGRKNDRLGDDLIA